MHPSRILGRTVSGTLTLNEDSHGLLFSVDVPSTTTGDDILTSIRRRDVTACSFGFTIKEDSWTRDDQGETERELLDVDLLDVSLVTYPAYPQTDGLSIRSTDGQRVIQLGWYRGDKRLAMPMPGWVRSQILNKEREKILDGESEVERLRLQLELAKRL